MANTASALPYSLYRETRESSRFNGQWYARARHLKTYTFEEFIKHIADHGASFTRAEAAAVMYKMQDCLLELLLSGNKVTIGDLGTFYLSISTKPAANLEEFNVAENIVGVNLRFAASRRDLNNLTSPTLRKQTRFINVQDLVTEKERAQFNTALEEAAEDQAPDAGQ